MKAGGVHEPLRILVSRPDRIGDVILSTPVLSAIRRYRPQAKISFLVKPLVAPLVRGLKEVDSIIVYDPDGIHRGFSGWKRLVREIREGEFDASVVLHSTRKLASAIFAARVPMRVGPLSKPHSFFFFNHGIRQHRSRVEMHEADYNLELLEPLGISVDGREFDTKIQVSDEADRGARYWLEQKGWSPDQTMVAVHPGMGGSALNWPVEQYLELIKKLAGDGRQVLVTAGPHERKILNRFQSELLRTKGKIFFYVGDGPRDLDELAALYRYCEVVVAPSTGPLHIAVAMQKPVVSFYPKIRVQSQARWGPYLRAFERAVVFESSAEEEGEKTKIEGVTVQMAHGAVEKMIEVSH